MRILLALLITFAAAAQQQPIITTFSPTSGPAGGGTLVRITGDHLITPVQCILPCPPRVVFGDISVDATEESNHLLTVTTPAHAAGVVDVTIAITGFEPIVVKNGFTFIGGPESSYELVLLPVYIDGVLAGSNGTQWKTDFWIRNDGTDDVQLAPWSCPEGLACGGVFPLTYALPPGQALHNPKDLITGNRDNPSELFYIAKSPNPKVSMSLRVADVSRQDLNGGTDVPVIREFELLTESAQLLNVPLTPQFRVLLRIEEVAYTTSSFEVRLYPQTEQPAPPLQTVTVTASTRQSGTFRNTAAYAQVDLSAMGAATGPVRVEVRPLTPGSRYWALASITNNDTQLVTLATPQ